LKILIFIIRMHLLLAAGAVSLALATESLAGAEPGWHPYLGLIFFSTLLEYTFHRLIRISEKKPEETPERYAWSVQNKRLLAVTAILAALASAWFFYCVQPEVKILVCFLALLTLLYSLSDLHFGGHSLSLKRIPFLKTLMIALIWTGVTVLVPFAAVGKEMGTEETALLFTSRFFFILALAIPFDIRDRHSDILTGIRSIPAVTGETTALRLANFSIGAFGMLSGGLLLLWQSINQVPALLLTTLASVYLINNRRLQKHPLYYELMLDGLLLLAGLSIWLFSRIAH
jgi:4-hydroxybenzoate polyprenyltransferase